MIQNTEDLNNTDKQDIGSRLFYSAYPDEVQLLMSEGLNNSTDSAVRLCNNSIYSVGFIAMTGFMKVASQGSSIDVQKFDDAVTISIDTQMLDVSMLKLDDNIQRLSQTGLLPSDIMCYWYEGHIPTEALTVEETVSKEDSRIPNCFY